MRRRITVAALALGLVAAGAPTVVSSEPEAVGPPETQPSGPTLVREQVVTPRRRVTRVVRFTPPAHAAPGYVRGTIIPHEATKQGTSVGRLSFLIRCESTFQWWASNGQYQGLGQFGTNAWGRGVASIARRSQRRVRLVDERSVLKRRKVIRYWSDGTRTAHRGRYVRVRIRTIRRGLLPRYPGRDHAWAQTRILAKMLAGRIGNLGLGEWDPRCRP